MPGMAYVLCLQMINTTSVSDRCRRGFPSSCFQLLQADHLHESLEEILAGEHGIPRFDPRHLENPNTLVFLRRAADLSLARFLQILVFNPLLVFLLRGVSSLFLAPKEIRRPSDD